MEILNKKTIIKEERPQGRQPKFTAEFMMLIGKMLVEEGIRFRDLTAPLIVS